MSPREAVKLSGRGEWWLRNHACAWCDANLLIALRGGCQALYLPLCDPEKKNFGPDAMPRKRVRAAPSPPQQKEEVSG